MLSPEQKQHVQPRLMTLQIVAAAMTMGVVFLFIVSLVMNGDKAISSEMTMLPMMGALTALFLFVLAMILPSIFASAVPAADVDSATGQSADLRNAGAAAGLLFNSRLIRAALLEAGCFLNLVLFMIEGSAISLGAAGFGFLLMLITFPLQWRMLSWLDERVG